MGRRLGIIVGVNSYQDTAFQPLRYAETDALALAQWLVNTQGGNWSPADVQHVQGAHATRELVESLIAQMCVNDARPGDLVVVYFAGHAFVDESSGEGYLALANTEYRQPATTGLHLASLAQQAMGRSRASHVAFVLDCFQTGAAWNMQRASAYDNKPLLGPTLLNALQQTQDRLMLCSCRGNELAPESGEKNLGSFVYRTIVGLCGSANNATPKQITLQRLHAFLFSSLAEQQRPQLFGREGVPFVLVGDMPTPQSLQQSGPLPPQPSGPFSPQQSGPLPSSGPLPFQQSGPLPLQYSGAFPPTFAPPLRLPTTGAPVVQEAHYPTATAQMSPPSSGQLLPSAVEQQATMLLRQARHLVMMQNPGEAFNVVEQMLRIAPDHIAALILKGQLLGTAGRFEEAQYVVEQVLQLDSHHALAWSMRAALLANMGQYQSALEAIERSLELDPNNPETHTIRTSIMGQFAAAQQSKGKSQKTVDPAAENRRKALAFFTGAGIAFLGLLLGVGGGLLLILQPKLPITLDFALQSLGLALLCVNATRGAYLHGIAHFLFALFMSVLTAGILGITFLVGRTRLTAMLIANPTLLVPFFISGSWLAVAATVPLLLALVGLIAGFIVRGIKKKKV